MTHKPGKAAVAKHLVELRREAVGLLETLQHDSRAAEFL